MKLFPYMNYPKICLGILQSWLRKHLSQADQQEYSVYPRKEMYGYSSVAREQPWLAQFASSQSACCSSAQTSFV